MKFAFLIYFLIALSSNLFADNDKSIELKILVYNTHGLPGIFLRDKPEIRFPLIGDKTKEYELSLLQEDYAHHRKLISATKNESKIFRGRLGNKLLCPICTGSGLTSIANLPQDWNIEVANESFKTCSGWISGWNDCFAKKGFQILKITPPLRESLFLVNTHLDAGSRESDREARKNQLNQIISTLNETIKGEALILVGDLNLNSKNSEDLKLLQNLKEKLSLTDAFLNISIDEKWQVLDYILFRKGKSHSFIVTGAGEDTSLYSKEGPLSDHPALSMRIRL
jgi:hypothetical protein